MRIRVMALAALATLSIACSDDQLEEAEKTARKAGEAIARSAKKAGDTLADAPRSLDPNALIAHCCYSGPYALEHLGAIRFARGTHSHRVHNLLQGLEKATTIGGVDLPLEDIEIADLTDTGMRATLAVHDANRNGFLEEPELTVLYLLELAKGLDKEATGLLLKGEPVKALRVSAAERAGIAEFARRVRKDLSSDARAIFVAVDELAKMRETDGR